jgi:hypothetical protein
MSKRATRNYRESHPEKVRETQKQYVANNYDQVLENHRRWAQNNREKTRVNANAWYQKNKDKKHAYYLKRKAERLANVAPIISEQESPLPTTDMSHPVE